MNGPPSPESRADIADLVHRYAFNIRWRLGAACGALFAEDATFEVRDADPLRPAETRTRSSVAGRAAIVDYIASSGSAETRVCPLIHNLLIEVTGETALGSCIMTTRTWPGGQELIGEYSDTFRYDTGWRFQSRIFTILRTSG